jgi:hypothetical protein
VSITATQARHYIVVSTPLLQHETKMCEIRWIYLSAVMKNIIQKYGVLQAVQ